LLERLNVPFEVADPAVDEAVTLGEPPEKVALRLAALKAGAVAAVFPDALIIGSDQVALLAGATLSKPGNHVNAVAQLRALRGRTVVFMTAVAVLDSQQGTLLSRLVPTEVEFRALSDEAIERYLAAEQPYDCAGSAKIEGLGIVLIRRMAGEDPTALIGLPLIALVDLLAGHGYSIL
jgi:septum formation protein